MKERRVINKWKSTLQRVLNTGDERMSLVLQTCETMLTNGLEPRGLVFESKIKKSKLFNVINIFPDNFNPFIMID